MKYQRVLTELYRKPWAILPEKFATIMDIVKHRAAGEKLTQDEIRARLGAMSRREPQMQLLEARGSQGQEFGTVAVIPVYGVISHRMNMMSQISGGTSTERLTGQFRQAVADPGVKAIVFDIDSPGGSVEGVPEVADEILKSRSKKKTIAVANSLAASAAYWIASAAQELIVIPSGQVGSIGVFTEHQDFSKALEAEGVKVSLISAGKYKVEGNPYEPLSDEARAELQQKVEAYYGMFVKAVAKGRGVSQAAVRDGFGQGRVVLAGEALKQKMVDGVATLDDTLARLGTGSKKMAAGGETQILADMFDDDPDDSDQDPDNDDDCGCDCSACMASNCVACVNAACADVNCEDCPNQASARAEKATAIAMNRRRRELDLHK